MAHLHNFTVPSSSASSCVKTLLMSCILCMTFEGSCFFPPPQILFPLGYSKYLNIIFEASKLLLKYKAFSGNCQGIYTAPGAKVIISRGNSSFVQLLIIQAVVNFSPPFRLLSQSLGAITVYDTWSSFLCVYSHKPFCMTMSWTFFSIYFRRS